MTEHNHVTRDIKTHGECPACDEYHEREVDLSTDPEFKAWAAEVHAHLLPKLQQSALTISLVPKGETDIKFAVELGMSIMLDKPIIAVVTPGTKVPERLIRVADAILDLDLNTPEAKDQLMKAVENVIGTLEQSDVADD